MGYRFDTHSWPVVCFEFVGRLSADELKKYFADSDALMSGSPFAVVVDCSHMLVPEVEFVRKQANWLREHSAEMTRVTRGVALVVHSTLIRGLIRAVLHFQDIPVAYEWFADRDHAMTWASARTKSMD
jgi:hypothetical protein